MRLIHAPAPDTRKEKSLLSQAIPDSTPEPGDKPAVEQLRKAEQLSAPDPKIVDKAATRC